MNATLVPVVCFMRTFRWRLLRSNRQVANLISRSNQRGVQKRMGCKKPERASGKEAAGLGLGKYIWSSPCQLPGHGAVNPIIPLRALCHLVFTTQRPRSPGDKRLESRPWAGINPSFLTFFSTSGISLQCLRNRNKSIKGERTAICL